MILCLQDQAAEAFPKRSLIHLNSIDDLNRSGIECWVEKCGVGVGQRTVIRRSNPRTTSGDLLSPISIVAHTPRITKNSRTTVIFCVSERESRTVVRVSAPGRIGGIKHLIGICNNAR